MRRYEKIVRNINSLLGRCGSLGGVPGVAAKIATHD